MSDCIGPQICHVRSTNRTIRLRVKRNGEPLDLTNAKGVMMVKCNEDDDDADAIIDKRTANFGGSDAQFRVIAPAADGIVEIKLAPLDGETDSVGLYIWAVKMLLQGGEQFNFIMGAPFSLIDNPIQVVIA